MKTFTWLVFLSVVLMFSSSTHAQENTPFRCGTSSPEDNQALLERVIRHKAALAAQPIRFRATQYVPIKFHLVGQSDGSGRINENTVFDQLAKLNIDFDSLGIQFYMRENKLNYINNNAVYSDHQGTINTIMSLNRDSRALNIFIVNRIYPDDPGVKGYYSFSKDWIVIDRTSIGFREIALSHEVGHYFGMPHTFLGWEEDPYTTEGTPAPATSPGNVPTERVDGSNCNTAGDRICDTPADYNLGFGNSGCEFRGNVLDPMGAKLDPDERLFMGYFLLCPAEEYYFSDMQKDLMLEDLADNTRNYLRANPAPFTAVIEEAPVLISPANNATTEAFNTVTLEWQGVPNATTYLLEVARIASFTIDPIRLIVHGTSKVITGLEADKKYFWRVRPFNMYSTPRNYSPIYSFTTGLTTAVSEPSQVLSWRVLPNPVSLGQDLFFEVNAEAAFTAQVSLHDLGGRSVRQWNNYRFPVGESRLAIPSDELSSGLYLLRVRTEEGIITAKVIVAR